MTIVILPVPSLPPPEFCPGVPWKGLQNIDPENDPNMTPGSVPSGPTINTNIQDVNRYLQRDRSGGEDGGPGKQKGRVREMRGEKEGREEQWR